MNRLSALQRALAAEEPLPRVRGLIPDDGEKEQQVVVFAYACILETGSSGLSILFDRFEEEELEKIDGALESIGAKRTLGDFRSLSAAFQEAIADGEDRGDAAERLVAQADAQRIDRGAEGHVQEMKERLLDFCNRNIEALAAG